MGSFNLGGNKRGGLKPTGPPEPVTIRVNRNQVVVLGIPYQTPRAAEIRNCVNFKVLTDKNERMYFFNADEEIWTTVTLKSTDLNPVLSAPPIAAVEKAFGVLSRCSAVSKVTIVDDDEQPITMAQVRAMDFISLEEQAAAAAEEPNDEDEDPVAEAVVELQGLTEKQAELIEKQTVEIESLKTELGTAAAKQATDEVNIQWLIEKVDSMESAINQLGACVNEVYSRTTTSDSPVDAPPDPPADVPADPDPSSSTSARDAATPKSKPNRLEAAAAKKRRMVSGGGAATIDVTHDSDDDAPLTKSTTRKRAASKAK